MKEYNPRENFEKERCDKCQYYTDKKYYISNCKRNDKLMCYQKYLEEQNKQMNKINEQKMRNFIKEIYELYINEKFTLIELNKILEKWDIQTI